MKIKTKIICTIGPSVASLDKMLALIDAGMNVARINFSHGTHEDHQKSIDNLKKAREIKDVPLAIMLDNKGPEVRVGQMPEKGISVEAGAKMLICKKPCEGDETRFSVTPSHIVDELMPGQEVLIDDGYIEAVVIEQTADGAIIEIKNDGRISSQKGINIPNADLSLPSLTEKDIDDIRFGCQNDIDIIAASFIRSDDDILAIKRLLHENDCSDTLVIAKIESALGVKNFDSILQVADGIMVARGDLGVEVPLNTVPKLQKMMIKKCYSSAKICVTATQMLESMIYNPRPTRAEVSDVANAIYDSTSAVMLSGETAVGKYPIECCKLMRGVIEEAEADFDYRAFFYRDLGHQYNDISSSVALAGVKTSYSAQAKALFTFTSSGFTARVMARFRPQIPIIALTSSRKTYQQLSISWGVVPALTKAAKNVKEAFIHASCFAITHKVARYGDLVVVTAGSSFGISGTTNTMIVRHIGDVLVRGKPGDGHQVFAQSVVLLTSGTPVKDRIAVTTRCDEETLQHLEGAAGIILQNSHDDLSSEKRVREFAKKHHIPFITRADGATSLLADEPKITLDPHRGLVFKGPIPSEEEIIGLVCPAG